MSIKTGKELATAAEAVARKHKTLYVMGCFGAPMTSRSKDRYTGNHSFNRQTERTVRIKSATEDTFGFDCVCFIKGLLWGWNGDKAKTYGGASYCSNGVPDINADQMIRACKEVSTDFSRIAIGEAVWMEGHIGIYIGNGLAVESTPRWADGVQVTAVHNIGTKSGYNGRKWTKHGKLPYVTYTQEAETKPTETKKEGYTLELRNIKNGHRGEDVRALQILLNGRGYNCGTADGIFGSKTDSAVRKYQKDKGLTVDGIVGPATMSRLMGV